MARFPSLCIFDNVDLTALNQAAVRTLDETGLDFPKISNQLFEKWHWLNRPAWWWRRVQDLDAIDEVRDPWSIERPDAVFCEDISEFLPQDAARDFVADVPAAAPQRWVVDTSTKEGAKFANELSGVAYVPPVQFTL